MKPMRQTAVILLTIGILAACQKEEFSQIADNEDDYSAINLKSGQASVAFGTLTTISFIGVEYAASGNSTFRYQVLPVKGPSLAHWALNIMPCQPAEGESKVVLVKSTDKYAKYGKDGSLKKYGMGYIDLPWLQFTTPYKKGEPRTVSFTLKGHWYVGDVLAIAEGGNQVYTATISGPVCKSPWNCGDPIVDSRDGNEYPTVQIGTQCWMAANLKAEKYVNGNPIVNAPDWGTWQNNTTGAWRYYNDDSQYNSTYGKLYNWQAVNNSGKICPIGWHVPSDDEWKTLELHLGMDLSEVDGTAWRGRAANVGGKLKKVDPLLWSDPNTGANNESGFSGIPGGRYNGDGTFCFLGLEGTWWTSTLTVPNTSMAWIRILNYEDNGSYRTDPLGHMGGGGFSIRCIKD